MAINNYGELKATITEWMDRPQLLDSVNRGGITIWPIDIFCSHVESECNRKLRTEDMAEIIFTRACDESSMVLLPDNALGARLVTVSGVDADYVTPEQFTEAADLYCGKPLFTRVANQIHVYPALGPEDDVTIIAYITVEPLVNDADQNWLLRKFPDVYLYGCLYEACAYVVDTENAMQWKQKFDIAIQDMIESDAIDKWSGSTLSIRSA